MMVMYFEGLGLYKNYEACVTCNISRCRILRLLGGLQQVSDLTTANAADIHWIARLRGKFRIKRRFHARPSLAGPVSMLLSMYGASPCTGSKLGCLLDHLSDCKRSIVSKTWIGESHGVVCTLK